MINATDRIIKTLHEIQQQLASTFTLHRYLSKTFTNMSFGRSTIFVCTGNINWTTVTLRKECTYVHINCIAGVEIIVAN